MGKEHQQGRDRYTPRFDFSELSFGVLGLLEQSRERARTMLSSLDGRRVVESSHKNWDHVNYCRHLSVDAPQQYSVEQLLSVFPANFRAFTDEYCLGSLKRQYPLAVQAAGTTGFDSTYRETLSDQAERFQQEKIVKQGKRHQRGAVEVLNSQRLDRWLAEICFNSEIPAGSKLVWCSPPGFKVEGYHGISPRHHSFIWVYEKHISVDGSPYMTMTQFRCWPSLSQMEQIQRHLQHKGNIDAKVGTTVDEKRLTRRNKVISTLIELPPEVPIEEIEDEIYATEETWAVQRDDMPTLSEERVAQFEAYRDELLQQFLIPGYRWLLAQHPKLADPYASAFWTSPEYRQLITHLDTLFAIGWQNLLKMIELIDEKHASPAQLPSLDLLHLSELFTLKMKVDEGNASRADKLRFNDIAPTLLSVGSRSLSVGQCGLGTLIPVQLLKGIPGLSSLSEVTSVSGLNRFDILNLSARDKLLFKAQLIAQYKPMTLMNRFGKAYRFWVRSEYYDEYLQHSYVGADGKCYGPCDVPLHDGVDEFVLSDSKYQELIGATTQPNLSTLAHIESAESSALLGATSEAAREEIRRYFRAKRQKLKERVSVTELVNNDLFQPTFARV